MNQELLPIVLDGEKYLQFFSFGFGIWMDLDWRKLGWDVDNPGKNYFSPEAFGEHDVRWPPTKRSLRLDLQRDSALVVERWQPGKTSACIR